MNNDIELTKQLEVERLFVQIEMERLKFKIEDMKCCGNCGAQQKRECPKFKEKYNSCPVWQYDGLTKNEREK